jgi:hypothetical protein
LGLSTINEENEDDLMKGRNEMTKRGRKMDA